MDITINPSDGVPIYRQIANQIRYMVASGLLKPGEEIPSVRGLALRLKVTPNTVVKAYHELESAGVLEKRPGAGTYVKAGPTPLAKQERDRIIEQRIDTLLAEGHQRASRQTSCSTRSAGGRRPWTRNRRRRSVTGSMVEVNGLSRRFNGTLALDEVSYRAGEAKVYGLVGANGAGKTTLIKHLLGLFRAKSGSVRMFGLDPVRNPVQVLRRTGYLSEERELPEWMLVEELMRYTQAFHPNWDMEYANRLLETFELDSRMKILELSRGMRAQVGIVAAVAHRPDLLILDEPSSGLDAVVRKDILDAMVRAVADDGRTVLFSSHLLDEVERMADHVTMIHQGRVVLDGSLENVRGAHERAQIRFLTGWSGRRRSKMLCRWKGTVAPGAWSTRGRGTGRASVEARGGEVVQSREATLEEIFVARVGRAPNNAEAA